MTPESIFEANQKMSTLDSHLLRHMGGHFMNLAATPGEQHARLVLQFALQLAPVTMGAQGGVSSSTDVRATLCWNWATQIVEHMPVALREYLLAPQAPVEFPPVEELPGHA